MALLSVWRLFQLVAVGTFSPTPPAVSGSTLYAASSCYWVPATGGEMTGCCCCFSAYQERLTTTRGSAVNDLVWSVADEVGCTCRYCCCCCCHCHSRRTRKNSHRRRATESLPWVEVEPQQLVEPHGWQDPSCCGCCWATVELVLTPRLLVLSVLACRSSDA